MRNNARTLTLSLGGRWHGHCGTAPCLVCQPDRRRTQTALTLRDGSDGRLLAHCKKGGCAFADILAAAGVSSVGFSASEPALAAQHERERRAQAERRARQAHACWHGATARRLPALVALVEGSDDFAVHRTYLAVPGRKADVEPDKASLGPIAGGAVRLTSGWDDTNGSEQLVVAKGIETALSLASGLLRSPATIWAALSTSGVRGLRLPARVGTLTIAPDGDDAGRAAAQALAERAPALGWGVRLLPAPKGQDWNDVLRERARMLRDAEVAL